MKRENFSEQRRLVLLMGATAVAAAAAPAMAMANNESAEQPGNGKTVVSGRVVCEKDGRPLAGAQIEIWQADARGVRSDSSQTAATDGDGRYFAVLKGGAQRLHYRVSHKDYTTKVAQLHIASARQREAVLTRDQTGTMRVAFEMTLTPRNQQMAAGTAARAALA